jgi:UDPglucose 6-dehydrogenase
MAKAIACIGNGFVGGSLTTVFNEKGFIVYAYDKSGKYAPGAFRLGETEHAFMTEQRPTSVTNLVEIAEADKNFSGIYFVCLPTPMFENGACDLSIIEPVLHELANTSEERIAVIKSTIPPGTTEHWNKMFKGTGLRIIHCPEFLTEANALNDMRNQNRIVLGGPRPQINKVKQLFQTAFPTVPIIKTSSTTSEMVKYFTNIQLATRVVLSCEFNQLCEKLDNQGMNVDFDKVVEYAKYDVRLGGTHMNAQGNDGVPGARGHCFPKDLGALVFLSQKLGIVPSLMAAVQEKNLSIIPPEHRDWEKMPGRGVSKKE